MDINSNKPFEGLLKQKSFVADDALKPVILNFEKQNAVLPKIKTRPASNGKSAANPSASNCRPHFYDRRSARPGTTLPMHSQSSEKKRPDTPSPKSSTPSPLARRSAPSSPLLRPTITSPNSDPSTPTFSNSSSSNTPAQDSLVEKQNSSRQSFGGRGADGLWPSMRSLSSSFNSEYPIWHRKKDGPVRSPSPERMLMKSSIQVSERMKSPLRGRSASSDQSENASPEPNTHQRVINHHRWPGMRGGKVSTMAISGSMDFIDRIGRSASLMLQSRGLSPIRRIPLGDGINKFVHKSSIKSAAKAEVAIDSDVSTISCQVDKDKTLLTTDLSRSMPLHMGSLCRLSSPKKNEVVSSSAIVAPITSISRSSSPSRSSNGTKRQTGSLSALLNNNIDIRNGIKDADMEDVHQLRLLYNREVQWCFVNFRAEVASIAQKIKAENILTNMWNATSELLYTVNTRRINVESLKQEIKLQDLLKKQVSGLEDWIALEEEYSTSLSGTIEALIANTLQLPVTGRARVDVRAVKNAVSSAIDIMQAMGSSVCYLLSRVESTKDLLSELSAVVGKEKSMFDQCRELLAATATMQVGECSLRAEILQNLRHVIHGVE